MKNIALLGYGGVDIFLFSSGIGCYYSFMKEEDILDFIKRRFWKIIPTYWSFIIVWIAYQIYKWHMPVTAIIGNIFCIQNFTGKGYDFNWYMSAMWLFYILTPIMAKIIDRIKSYKQMLVCISLLILLSICFWNSETLIITISRIPIYFIGMYFAKIFKERESISKSSIAVMLILTSIGYMMFVNFYSLFQDKMWNYALWWYPFILITPGLCIGISIISSYIDKYKIGEKVYQLFYIIGNNTFEIYLVHILLFKICNEVLFLFKLFKIII